MAGDAPRKDANLNRQIRADIERHIMSGEWSAGERIPRESELMVRYGCSRMTVNKALSSLVEAGLIERRRRAGSFVRRPQALSAVLEIHDLPSEIKMLGGVYEFQSLGGGPKRRLASPTELAELTLSNGDVIEIKCRHLSSGTPFALEERIINLTAVPHAALVDFAKEPPGSWLLQHVPWTEAEHRIAAVSANRGVANRLQIEVGAPCLMITRRTWRDGQAVTRVHLTYPGKAHQLVARFRSTQQGR